MKQLMQVRRIMRDSIRVYFAPLTRAFKGIKAELQLPDSNFTMNAEESIRQEKIARAAPELLDAALICDGRFLHWLANRIVNVYGEDPNMEFLLALREKARLTEIAINKATS